MRVAFDGVVAAVVIGVYAAVAALAIYLVVRHRKRIATVFYEDPAEFLRYVLRNLPALTLTVVWAIVKFVFGRLFTAALAAGYAFLGFRLLEAWFRMQGITRGGELYSRPQVLGLVAGSVLAAQLTLAAVRGLRSIGRAFRNRHSLPSKREISAAVGTHGKSRTSWFSRAVRKTSQRVRFPGGVRLRPGRFTGIVFVFALAFVLLGAFEVPLSRDELVMVTIFGAALVLTALFFESRKRSE